MKKRIVYFLFIPFLVLMVYVTFFYIMKNFIYAENNKITEFLKTNSFDCIVIFTGDTGRIPLGIITAELKNIPKIFITGVFSKNKISTILKKNFTNKVLTGTELNIEKSMQKIEIDYQAQNTLGNCISTLQFLRKEKNYKNILVVSSDYHLIRMSFIFHKLQSPDDNFSLFYLPVKGLDYNFRSFKLVTKEIVKLFNVQGIFLFWDSIQ